MKTFLFFALLVLSVACNKPGPITLSETPAPVLKIIAPVAGDHFKTGDPLCFKGTVLAGKQLVIVRLKLFGQGDGRVPLMQFDYVTAERSFEVEKKIMLPASLKGSCNLQFEAVDISGASSSSVLVFSAN